MQKSPAKKPIAENTSWGAVAEWYDEHLKDSDSYHQQVILPNLLRVLAAKQNEHILDVACGQGFFSREMAKTGAQVTGCDISKELIAKARAHDGTNIEYRVASADALSFAKDHSYDAAIIVLAIQNIENIQGVFNEIRRVLTPNGRCVIVMNHPAFRVPRHSDWGWDEKTKTQYRKTDRYLSTERIDIIAHPGKSKVKRHQAFTAHCKIFSNQ